MHPQFAFDCDYILTTFWLFSWTVLLSQLEQTFKEEKLEIKDEDLEKAVASDGKLPGGMDPETFKKLIGNPEVMALLQSPKMQEVTLRNQRI